MPPRNPASAGYVVEIRDAAGTSLLLTHRLTAVTTGRADGSQQRGAMGFGEHETQWPR
jgi:hypothetical protein